jgi:hypothetical protein
VSSTLLEEVAMKVDAVLLPALELLAEGVGVVLAGSR